MAINTNADNNMLGLRDIIRASGPLLATRNSKGRIAPVHIQGPPGVGKTILVNLVAKAAARRQPGVPYGMITFNPGVSRPRSRSPRKSALSALSALTAAGIVSCSPARSRVQ